MNRVLLGLVALALLPTGGGAQTELGIDAGAVIRRVRGNTVTTVQVPTSWLRIGFPAGNRVIIEPLITFVAVSGNENLATALEFVPGVDFLLGEGGAYLRGEVAIVFTSSGSNSDTDVGFGGAIGTRRVVEDETALVRVEAAVQRWPGEFSASTMIRILVGFSLVVG